jgi:hypothetical protein
VKEQVCSTLGFDWFLNNKMPESIFIVDYITNNKTFNKTIEELFNQYPAFKITRKINSCVTFFIKDMKRSEITISKRWQLFHNRSGEGK